jgi:hypothetical protein
MTVKPAISIGLVTRRGKGPMPCKIGITMNPDEKRVFWENQAAGFTNWQILELFRSKAAAQEYETAYALRHGCEADLGGADVPGTSREPMIEHEWWYIYHFDYKAETG